MGYAYPSDARYVSCSWQCHKDRVPCSAQPGTDYAAAYGSQLYAVGDGVVVRVKTSPSTGEGRAISVDLDDGRLANSLHLSTTGSAYVGMRVSRGQAIPGAKTGASGFGVDWYYGPHVHQTLWPTQAFHYCCNCTIDFDTQVGDVPTPTPGDDDMPFILIESLPDRGRALIGPNYYKKLSNSEELTAASQMAAKTLRGNARQFDVWKALALQGQVFNALDTRLDNIDSAIAGIECDAGDVTVPPISDEDVARIADATADEVADRMKS